MSTPDRKENKPKAADKPVVELSRAAQALVVQTKNSMGQMSALDKKFDALARQLHAVAVVGEKIASFDARLNKIENSIGALGASGKATTDSAALQEQMDRKLGNLTTRLGKALEDGFSSLGTEQRQLRQAVEESIKDPSIDGSAGADNGSNSEAQEELVSAVKQHVESVADRMEASIRKQLQSIPQTEEKPSFDQESLVKSVAEATAGQVSEQLQALALTTPTEARSPVAAELNEAALAELRQLIEGQTDILKTNFAAASKGSNAPVVDTPALTKTISTAMAEQLASHAQSLEKSLLASFHQSGAKASEPVDGEALAFLQSAMEEGFGDLKDQLSKTAPGRAKKDIDVKALAKSVSTATAAEVAEVLKSMTPAPADPVATPPATTDAPAEHSALSDLREVIEAKFTSLDKRLASSKSRSPAPAIDIKALAEAVSDVIGPQIVRAVEAHEQASVPVAHEPPATTSGAVDQEALLSVVTEKFDTLMRELERDPVVKAELSFDVEGLTKSVSDAASAEVKKVIASTPAAPEPTTPDKDQVEVSELLAKVDQKFSELEASTRDTVTIDPDMIGAVVEPLMTEVRGKLTDVEALLRDTLNNRDDADNAVTVDPEPIVEKITAATSKLLNEAFATQDTAPVSLPVDSIVKELRLTIEEQMRGVRQEMGQTSGLKAERLRIAMELLLTEFRSKLSDLDSLFTTMRRQAEESSRAIQDMALKPIDGAYTAGEMQDAVKLLQADMARLSSLVSKLVSAETTAPAGSDGEAVRTAIIEQISLIQPTIAKAVLSLLEAEQPGGRDAPNPGVSAAQ